MNKVNDKTRIVLEIKDLSLDIPLYLSHPTTIKNSIIKAIRTRKIERNSKIAYVRVLNNINCIVREGERIALIGKNGSGKTTFLRLVSRIYNHTKGTFFSKLKVHPIIDKSFITSNELNGLSAMKAHYLQNKYTLKGFDEFYEDVLNFTGLGEFIDMPIKTYSEGMKARLQFAIMTYGTHESIALDEGFATGDSDFQSNARKRLDLFLSKTGTLFFASHSDSLLENFCKRGLVFNNGKIIYDDSLEKALDFYYKRT